jgi:hypothetical protein
MKYVSATWVPDDTGDEASGSIRAVGDDGNIYWVSSHSSTVPPWPEFLAEGGTVGPPENTTDENITSAPDDLTGGPTLGEIFHGNQ